MKKCLFPALLAMAAMLVLASCETEQAIRAKLEAEFKQKMEASMKQPKYVLSPSDLKIVLSSFRDADLKFGDTTQICKLGDGRVASFYFGKNMDHNLMIAYDGARETARVEGLFPATLLGGFREKFMPPYCKYTTCPEADPTFPVLRPGLESILNTIDVGRIFMEDAACFDQCKQKCPQIDPDCERVCFKQCYRGIKEIRGW